MDNFKNIYLLFAFILFSGISFAQNNNRVPFYYGEVAYKKPSVFNSLIGIAAIATKDPQISLEDETLVDPLTNALKTAAGCVYRLVVQEGNEPDGQVNEEAYVLDATFSNVMSGTGKWNSARADVELRLTNLQNGREVAKRKYELGASDFVSTKEECIADLSANVTKKTQRFLWSNFPIYGSILEKGVEQNNGKVKENQCYIDLGEQHSVFVGMTFVVCTSDNDKLLEIGQLKIKEVAGDDISICSITKGDKKISAALAAGQKIIVRSNIKP